MLSLAEALLIRHFKPSVVDASGVQHTLNRVAAGDGVPEHKLPRLVIVQGFLPFALVARGVAGRGSILLSQGLLASLNEGAVRDVLSRCIIRAKEHSLPIRSLFSALWILLAGITPRPRSVFGAFGFLLLYPLLSFMAYFAGVGARPQSRTRLPMDVLADGAVHLYVVDPRSSAVVFRG